MGRNLRSTLGATAAVGALVLSSTAATQASTGPAAKAAPARGASSSRSPAATQAFPANGRHWLWTTYSNSGCLAPTGLGFQTVLFGCDDPTGLNRWVLTRTSPIDSRGGAWVSLQDVISDGGCLAAEDDSNFSPNTNGDPVITEPCDGAAEQTWYLWPLGGGVWMIVNRFNTNKVLDARTSGGATPSEDGDPVQLWDHVGTPQQGWEISP